MIPTWESPGTGELVWLIPHQIPESQKNIPKRRLEHMKLYRSSKYGQCLDLAAKWLSHKESQGAWEYQPGNDRPQIVGGHALVKIGRASCRGRV